MGSVFKFLEVNNMYEDFFNNNRVAFFIVDNGFYIHLSNKAGEKILDCKKEELEKGIPFFEFIFNDDIKKFKDFCKSLEDKNDESRSVETRILTRNQIIKTILLTVNYLGNERFSLVAIDISERKEAENKVKYLGYYDNLTGLYNRYWYEKKLEEFNQKQYFPLSIIVGDNNALKITNDTFGHQEGDKIIKQVAKILKDSTRDNDIVARWGGDEFGIILPNTGLKGAEKVIKRIKDKCNQIENEFINPSIALGLGIKSCSEQSLEEVLKEAEVQMYEDKLESKRSNQNEILKTLENLLINNGYRSKEKRAIMESLVLRFGKYLQLSCNELNQLLLMVRFSEIGKISICLNNMKNKSSETRDRNFKKHSDAGYRVAKNFEQLVGIANAILFQNERWDGQGYPQGLKGERIPLLSRVIVIFNYYHTLKEKNLNKKMIIAKLEDKSGSEFDPELIRKFIDSNIIE